MFKVNFRKKIKLKRISVIACTFSAFVALFAISYNLGERYYVKHNEDNLDKSVFRVTYANPSDYKDEIIIYDTMHRMANSKIMAEEKDKSGSLQITRMQIEAVRTIVKQMNYPDNSYILGVLSRWEKGDFTLISDEHDYFFNRLREGMVTSKP